MNRVYLPVSALFILTVRQLVQLPDSNISVSYVFLFKFLPYQSDEMYEFEIFMLLYNK